MTELTVKLKYKHPLSESLLVISRISFPIWAIIAPLIALVGILGMYNLWPFAITSPFQMVMMALFIAAVGFRFNMLVEKSHLRIEKSGIELPNQLDTAFSSKYIAWNSISKIEAVLSNAARPRIVFYTAANGTRTLECSRMTAGELEQLLLAIQLWAPPPALDQTVKQLQDTIKPSSLLGDKQSLGPSYTALWEDELHRRFRQVAFLPLEPGALIRNGSLKVVRQLAMGGLSAIYLCQLDQRDLVVVKESVTPADAAPALKEKAEELFNREAQILMRISHRQIVKVLDHFVADDRSYMMLEYVKGQDLRQYVKQNGPVRESVTADWAMQVASVLEYLHDRQIPIIHRDLTPDNIVVRDDGTIVVIDFGAANEYIGNSTGTFVGKQCYIAPEQFRGKTVPQSDIYAFGCTLYFLLTGTDPQALSESHPREKNQMVSTQMDELIANCTAVETDKRIKNAASLIERIKTISGSQLSQLTQS